jgi:HD-GYP domain-containing protein (c-di-GMP phosphodiesterase class II)
MNDVSHTTSYIPIDEHTIRDEALQSFDVFFKTSEGKMVLYCASGEVVKDSVRESIKNHNLNYLYILKKDKIYYDLYLEEVLPNILSDPEIITFAKTKTTYDSIMNTTRLLFESPKADIIQRYKKTIYNTMDFVIKDNEALQNLISMTTFDFSVYNHSINVGIFSIGLTKELLGDNPDHNLAEMAAGFFLHDIGKCKISPNLLNKRGPLSQVEWKIMKKHPEEGCIILNKNNALSEEAEIILSQHHERYSGNGYPKGLERDQIHIYAKICSIADVFDGLTSFRPFRKKYSSFKALTIMKNEMYRDFDPEFFSKFVKLFFKQ